MAFFYHVIGLGLMFAASSIAYELIEDYEEPSIPVSVVSAIAAGPIEEILFFGIPFYFSFNPYLVLGGGVLWSALHILNTESLAANSLPYGIVLFTASHLFFSVRTWISKKGWFAIGFHSSWNLAMFLGSCGAGLRTCLLVNEGDKFILDVLSIPVSVSLSIIIYLMYLRTQGRETQTKFLIIILIVLSVAEISFLVMNWEELISQIGV